MIQLHAGYKKILRELENRLNELNQESIYRIFIYDFSIFFSS